MPLTLRSPAFQDHGAIPTVHTCDGADTAPPLEWGDVPTGTKSLVLVVDDPDAPNPVAPTHTHVHWVLYDIPPSTTSLPAGGAVPDGAREGLNSWRHTGYGGPCPPIGCHRYFFKLHALDTTLGDRGTPTADALDKLIRDHVIERAELVGTYQCEPGRTH